MNIYAGFWKRFLAHLLDQLILGVVKFILFIPFWIFALANYFKDVDFNNSEIFTSIHLTTTSSDQLNVALFTTFIFVVIIFAFISIIMEWLYCALMESSHRQATLGKIIVGIKVTDLNGNRISFGRATGRHFGKILSSLFLFIGYIMAGFTEKKQALHDIISNCLVVNAITMYYELPQQ